VVGRGRNLKSVNPSVNLSVNLRDGLRNLSVDLKDCY